MTFYYVNGAASQIPYSSLANNRVTHVPNLALEFIVPTDNLHPHTHPHPTSPQPHLTHGHAAQLLREARSSPHPRAACAREAPAAQMPSVRKELQSVFQLEQASQSEWGYSTDWTLDWQLRWSRVYHRAICYIVECCGAWMAQGIEWLTFN